VLDAQQGQIFTISPTGQLMSGGSYFSTSGLVPFENFTPRSYEAAISTTFSNQDNILAWMSPSFAMGQAQFCLTGTMLEAAYDGYLPAGCIAVNVHIALVSAATTSFSAQQTSTLSVSSMAVGSGTTVSATPTPTPSSPGSVHGRFAVADPVGCLTSPSNAPALSGISETASTLENCVDYCSAYSYFGVQNGACQISCSGIKANSDQGTYVHVATLWAPMPVQPVLALAICHVLQITPRSAAVPWRWQCIQ
jgi:hypothetical protein